MNSDIQVLINEIDTVRREKQKLQQQMDEMKEEVIQFLKDRKGFTINGAIINEAIKQFK